jgi:prepilin-type N-terminal cleavage/methylation domain-containing protein
MQRIGHMIGGRLRRRAFTMVEMLTVIAVIVLLLAIGVPSVNKMRANILREATKSTIYGIEGGCEQYKTDLREYPASTGPIIGNTTMDGRYMLAQYLTGYRTDDGITGFGFRIGKSIQYGPYNRLEDAQMASSGSNQAFVDSFGQEIYYYRCDRRGAASTESYYSADNSGGPPISASGTSYVTDQTGKLFRTDYVLMSKGANGNWDSFVDNARTDDITNFLQEN